MDSEKPPIDDTSNKPPVDDASTPSGHLRDLRRLIKEINDDRYWAEHAAETVEALASFKANGGFPDNRTNDGLPRDALPRALLIRLAATKPFRAYLCQTKAEKHLEKLTGYRTLAALDAASQQEHSVKVYARRARECLEENLQKAFPGEHEQDRRRRALLKRLLAIPLLFWMVDEAGAGTAGTESDTGEPAASNAGEPVGPAAHEIDSGAPAARTTEARHRGSVDDVGATTPERTRAGERQGTTRATRLPELSGPMAIHAPRRLPLAVNVALYSGSLLALVTIVYLLTLIFQRHDQTAGIYNLTLFKLAGVVAHPTQPGRTSEQPVENRSNARSPNEAGPATPGETKRSERSEVGPSGPRDMEATHTPSSRQPGAVIPAARPSTLERDAAPAAAKRERRHVDRTSIATAGRQDAAESRAKSPAPKNPIPQPAATPVPVSQPANAIDPLPGAEELTTPAAAPTTNVSSATAPNVAPEAEVPPAGPPAPAAAPATNASSATTPNVAPEAEVPPPGPPAPAVPPATNASSATTPNVAPEAEVPPTGPPAPPVPPATNASSATAPNVLAKTEDPPPGPPAPPPAQVVADSTKWPRESVPPRSALERLTCRDVGDIVALTVRSLLGADLSFLQSLVPRTGPLAATEPAERSFAQAGASVDE